MADIEETPRPNTSEHVHTRPNMSGHWLTIAEAVVYCQTKELDRTAKTIRRWALEAAKDLRKGVASARKQDTENGFRWNILRDWLDIKIGEELHFGLPKEQNEVGTRPDMSGHVHTGSPIENNGLEGGNTSKHVHTRSDMFGDTHGIIQVLKEQVKKKDEQLGKKDQQITALLERDRETNILIKGLQTLLLPSAGNNSPHVTDIKSTRDEND